MRPKTRGVWKRESSARTKRGSRKHTPRELPSEEGERAWGRWSTGVAHKKQVEAGRDGCGT